MSKTKGMRRRTFLRGAAAFAFPAIVPASAWGVDDRPAPGDRIVMGAIGVGSMGTGDTNAFLHNPAVQFVAVCDVDAERRASAKTMIDEYYGNSDCTAYGDYREMLARGGLDAVTIALPDHWHALAATAAARAGLDIYGQKPLARSICEGRAICDAVERYGRIWQTGSQQRSNVTFRHACELVRNGRIGKVQHVEIGLPTGRPLGPQPVMPVPETLDWDFWLGPAPWAPYTEMRCHWNWRWILDYSGGQLTDWSGHHIDIAHWGLDRERTGPLTIEGKGNYPTDGLWNTPTEYMFTCEYAEGAPMTIANNQQLAQGVKWYGEDGWVYVKRGLIDAEPKSLLTEVIGPDEIKLYESREHHQNFLDCVKSRRETIAPAEVGHRSISVGLLGEIAMLTGRKIRWNPETEKIIGDPGAAQMLGRSYREPWHLQA